MSIERNINGVIDHLMNKVEEVDHIQDMDFAQKMKITNQIVNSIWRGASLNLQHKKLLARAPDVAKNNSIPLQLGSDGK